jgi:hypothetical protein
LAQIAITLPEAKARAKQAHQAARKGDAVAAALYDRIYATAVACAQKRPERVAAVMYIRAAICLEILSEMKQWPAGRVAGLST